MGMMLNMSQNSAQKAKASTQQNQQNTQQTAQQKNQQQKTGLNLGMDNIASTVNTVMDMGLSQSIDTGDIANPAKNLFKKVIS